jgi:hypothetical protein
VDGSVTCTDCRKTIRKKARNRARESNKSSSSRNEGPSNNLLKGFARVLAGVFALFGGIMLIGIFTLFTGPGLKQFDLLTRSILYLGFGLFAFTGAEICWNWQPRGGFLRLIGTLFIRLFGTIIGIFGVLSLIGFLIGASPQTPTTIEAIGLMSIGGLGMAVLVFVVTRFYEYTLLKT